MKAVTQTGSDVLLALRITPRASKTEICGVLGDALKMRLQAPPVEGKANAALIKWLARKLDVSKRSVSICCGETGRNKLVVVEGLDVAAVRQRLGLSGTEL